MKKSNTYILILSVVLFSYRAWAVAPHQDSTAAKAISIMTWNVKLLPRGAVFLHHHPVVRAKLIPAKLMEENADVIIFQEAYDGLSIRIIKRKIKATYPFCMGTKNRKAISYKRAGGIIMFSKYPMKELESIKYSQCKGYIDCSASKGAMIVEVDHPAGKIQVLGTHIQAGGTKEIKESQFNESGFLLKKYEKEGVPQFACGDFNTKRIDTILYPKLINALRCEDGEICTPLKYTSDHKLNDMDYYDPEKRHLIDYVFVRRNGVKPISTLRSVKQIQQQWDKKHKDLSDHFPVILKMTL
jgi:endonuclease/exonuclease/phosphatase family metal-dependent hydrolase